MTSNPLMKEEQRTEAKGNDRDNRGKRQEWRGRLDDEDRWWLVWEVLREKKIKQKHEESTQETAQLKWKIRWQPYNHIRRIDSKGLKMLQKTDPSLESVRNKQIILLVVEVTVGHGNDTFWYILVESSCRERKLTPQ